jgi:hypothetical protein
MLKNWLARQSQVSLPQVVTAHNRSNDGDLAHSQLPCDTVHSPHLDHDCQGRNDKEWNGGHHKDWSSMGRRYILEGWHERLVDARCIIATDFAGHVSDLEGGSVCRASTQ